MTSSSRSESFGFEPPLPGSWTLVAFLEANHEAAHALAAVLLGIPVYEARIDRPDVGVSGHVVIDRDTEQLWKLMCVSLAPLILEGRCPQWPLSLRADDGDEFRAAVRAFDAGLTEDEYKRCVSLIEDFFAMASSKRALKALSGALLARGALDGEEIQAIVTETLNRAH
jgi:hypothetical protein